MVVLNLAVASIDKNSDGRRFQSVAVHRLERGLLMSASGGVEGDFLFHSCAILPYKVTRTGEICHGIIQ